MKKNGWVWVPGSKGKFKPFDEFHEITRGKNKGKLEVILQPSHPKRIIVDKSSIRSFPVDFERLIP